VCADCAILSVRRSQLPEHESIRDAMPLGFIHTQVWPPFVARTRGAILTNSLLSILFPSRPRPYSRNISLVPCVRHRRTERCATAVAARRDSAGASARRPPQLGRVCSIGRRCCCCRRRRSSSFFFPFVFRSNLNLNTLTGAARRRSSSRARLRLARARCRPIGSRRSASSGARRTAR
jgi:hypothetical protein